MQESSSFSTSLPTLVIFWGVGKSPPDGCEVVSHCGFDGICLMINDVEHLFMSLLATEISSLEKGLLKSFAKL